MSLIRVANLVVQSQQTNSIYTKHAILSKDENYYKDGLSPMTEPIVGKG